MLRSPQLSAQFFPEQYPRNPCRYQICGRLRHNHSHISARMVCRVRTARKTNPCRLIDKRKDAVTFPMNWNTMVSKRIIPTNTIVITCHRSITVPSRIMLSSFIKRCIKNGADRKTATVKTAAMILINRTQNRNNSDSLFLSPEP